MSSDEASATLFDCSPFIFKCVYDTDSDTADKKQRKSGASTAKTELSIFIQRSGIKKEKQNMRKAFIVKAHRHITADTMTSISRQAYSDHML